MRDGLEVKCTKVVAVRLEHDLPCRQDQTTTCTCSLKDHITSKPNKTLMEQSDSRFSFNLIRMRMKI